MYVFLLSVHYCFPISTENGLCGQIAVKFPNKEFHENLTRGTRIDYMRADKHGKAKKKILVISLQTRLKQ
jgi:hypothetical protein